MSGNVNPGYVWIRAALDTFKGDLPTVLRWFAQRGYTRKGDEPNRTDGKCTYQLGKIEILFTARSCRRVEMGEKTETVKVYRTVCE